MTSTIYESAEGTSLVEDASRRAGQYLEGLGERRVSPDADALAALDLLDGPLPEEGSPAAQVLGTLDEYGSPGTVASAGPRFFGFVHGGALPVSLAAHWLASAWDQNAFSAASSPVGVRIEAIALNWLLEILDLPRQSGAAFTTGATLANFTALAAARHRLLARSGWDADADGLFGAPPIDVYVSEESHPTVFKGLGLIGLGRARVNLLETDSQGRIRADRLPQISAKSLVCAQAGNVNSGAFDPFSELAEVCSETNSWLHVDGAFGLWARASRSKRSLAEGLESADSWATDGHKWLNVPYDCGIAMVRDAEALRAAMSISASYLPADAPREPMHFTPETSRRARGVEVWAALRGLGRQGVEGMIDRHCCQANRFADGLSAAGYSILNDVVLNQVVVTFGDVSKGTEKAAEVNAAINAKVIAAVQDEGICWCGATEWQGRSAMRISVSCWATRDEDVDRSLESILRCARSVGAGPTD